MKDDLRELISLGASAALGCEQCLNYHVASANMLGVPESEIMEAVEIGRKVQTLAVTSQRRSAGPSPSKADMAGGGCGGGLLRDC